MVSESNNQTICTIPDKTVETLVNECKLWPWKFGQEQHFPSSLINLVLLPKHFDEFFSPLQYWWGEVEEKSFLLFLSVFLCMETEKYIHVQFAFISTISFHDCSWCLFCPKNVTVDILILPTETEGFKIDTMGTYHGLSLESVKVASFAVLILNN